MQMGQPVTRRDGQPVAPLVRVYEPDGRFLGIARRKKTVWQPHKIFLPLS
jgi:hypothetical protein